jgi:hypothetical protein
MQNTLLQHSMMFRMVIHSAVECLPGWLIRAQDACKISSLARVALFNNNLLRFYLTVP